METTTLTRAAVLAPLPAVLLEPLTASAYFRTDDGRPSGDPAWISAWSEPLQENLGGLLTWSTPDTVYLTYGKVFALAVAGMLCALVAVRRADIDPAGRFRWAWRGQLAAYGLLLLGVVGEYWTPWTDVAFVAVTIPSMLLLFVTSPFLGARMLRQRVGSRTAAWMIAGTLPAFASLTALGGHLGFPVIWLTVAWVLHVRTLAPRPRLAAGAAVAAG